MEKEKIIFVIENDYHIRNYITSNVLDHLFKHYECFFFIDKKYKDNEHIDHLERKTFFTRSKNYYSLIFDLLMWRNREKSKSFKRRMIRTKGMSFHFDKKEILIFKIMRLGARFLRFLYFRLTYLMLGNSLLFPFVYWILNFLSQINPDLVNFIERINPKLVLYPSNAYSEMGIDLVKVCRKKGIRSTFIIDNWDNISSKSILWEKPDKILVWGEQTRQQAIKIQGFNPEQVEAFGSSRFDQYYPLRNSDLKSHFDFPYILYVGYSMPFDEAGLVKEIDTIISENKSIFGETKLVYRPHPYRQGKDSVDLSELKNTIIDPQLEEWYLEKTFKKERIAAPNLNYYPSLLKNAEMVIASLTSMIVESLIFKKKTLVIAYEEGNNPSSPFKVFHGYHHFDVLPETEGIDICYDFKEFKNNFLESWKNKDSINLPLLEKNRNFLTFNDDISFDKRLLRVCQEEIKKYIN